MISWTGMLGGKGTVSGKLLHEHIRFTPGTKPVVVWNLTRECNLRCIHCYQESNDQTLEAAILPSRTKRLLEDLSSVGVKILLLSGGEPLLRRDIYTIIEQAVSLGMRPAISTNGTLITPEVAHRLKAAGLSYAGVSLDGLERTHDLFRGETGAFRKAWEGIQAARSANLLVGIRFTLTRQNVGDLEELLNRVETEGVPRFCMYHLVYAGRGKQHSSLDVDSKTRRDVADQLFERASHWVTNHKEIELLSVDNHADGIYLLKKLQNIDRNKAKLGKEILTRHIGCPACCKIACISPSGSVHPCQFWIHRELGNVLEKDFSSIWKDQEGCDLRDRNRHLKGRCGRCVHQAYCGGCRIRAEHVYSDAWAEDPSCYLTDQEILEPL